MAYQDPYDGKWYDDNGQPLYDYDTYDGSQATGQQQDAPPDPQAPMPDHATDPNAPAAPPSQQPPPGSGYTPPQFGGPLQPDYNYYTPPPAFNAPTFSAPQFNAPTGDSIYDDPGYALRLGEGERGLKSFASHLGGLRKGSTIKDLIKYNQDFASQEYGNVYNRAADTFRTNYGVSRDVFDRNYTGARDAYAPKMTDWNSRMGLNKQSADDYFTRTYDVWKTQLDDAYRNAQLAAGQG